MNKKETHYIFEYVTSILEFLVNWLLIYFVLKTSYFFEFEQVFSIFIFPTECFETSRQLKVEINWNRQSWSGEG